MWNVFELTLFSSWFNLCLYSIELALVCLYFHCFSKDVRWIQCMVVTMLISDTVGTVASCSTTWTFLITDAMAPLTRPLWTMPTLIITSATTATIEELFLIYRIFSLSKTTLVSGFLALLVVTHAVFELISAGYIIRDWSYGVDFGTTATKIAYCVEVSVNILIPIALMWRLHKVDSTFQSTRNLLRQVFLLAFSSGCIVGFVGIAFLTLFWMKRYEFIIISYSYGRIYTITVIMNLLARRGGVSGKGVPSNGGNISRMFDVNFSTQIESIAPNNATTPHISSTRPETRENKKLVSQQSDETLQMV